MSEATALDKQINRYLLHLNQKQKKAVLSVVKTFAEDSETIEYPDTFKIELDKRYEEYKSGGKLISEAAAKSRIKTLINRKPRK